MRMIDRIKQAMRDSGACDWLTYEELEIAATAALEAMREPDLAMLDAIYNSEAYYVGIPAWRAAIDAALE